jgi:hypothetical protein
LHYPNIGIVICMRALSAVALILVLVLPIWGSYLGLRQQQRTVKRAVKHSLERGLADSELVHWRFSPAEARALDWKDAREFKHQGHMYDIVRAALVAGRVELWCWWDHEESVLEQRLEHLVRVALGADTDPQSPAARWGDWMKRTFTTTETDSPGTLPGQFQGWPISHDLAATGLALAPPSPPPNA